MQSDTRHCEHLESRRLLSADVVDGTLVVVGTNGPDRISMWEDIGRDGPVIIVYVDALLMGRPPEQYAIPREQVRSVLVRGLAGDDIIELDIAPLNATGGPLTVPARV